MQKGRRGLTTAGGRASPFHGERAKARMTSVRERDRQFRLVRVHHEHREELGRLRVAGIGAESLAVAGQLGEALSGQVDRRGSVIDLAADRTLDHGRVDEGGFGMRVARRVTRPDRIRRARLDELRTNALKCRAQVCPRS
jgi:hypothetical protein